MFAAKDYQDHHNLNQDSKVDDDDYDGGGDDDDVERYIISSVRVCVN